MSVVVNSGVGQLPPVSRSGRWAKTCSPRSAGRCECRRRTRTHWLRSGGLGKFAEVVEAAVIASLERDAHDRVLGPARPMFGPELPPVVPGVSQPSRIASAAPGFVAGVRTV